MKDNPFTQLDPHDGYRAQRVTFRDGMSVYIVLNIQGTLAEPFAGMRDSSEEVHLIREDQSGNPNRRLAIYAGQPGTVGQHLRAWRFVEALCRYFNSGGDWNELNDILDKAQSVIVGGFHLPGWRLLDCYFDHEENSAWTTIFGTDDGQEVVHWVEDVMIDTGLTPVEVEHLYVDPAEPVRELRGTEAGGDHAEAGEGPRETPRLRGPDSQG